MASDREFITLQLGNFANHVGTHWWNLQYSSSSYSELSNTENPSDEKSNDKISHDVLWRGGENAKGEVTYTPRAIILDEKSSMGTMSCSGGALYDEHVEQFDQVGRDMAEFSSLMSVDTWDSGTQFSQNGEIQQLTPAQHALNLGVPNVAPIVDPKWPDYSLSYFHPRSILVPSSELATVQSIVLSHNRHTQEDEQILTFNNWLLGNSLWSRMSFRDEFEDRIRLYSEECDWLEGFNFLTDSPEVGSGWSSLSPKICSFLDDDYHKKTQLHFPISKSSVLAEFEKVEFPMGEAYFSGFLGQALMLYELGQASSACDAVTPLQTIRPESIPTNFNPKYDSYSSDYFESVTLACYLETITTPWRMSDYSRKMRASDITRSLTTSRRRMYLDTKIAFRDDQVVDNFASLSGLPRDVIMAESSYASLPVARGTTTSPDAYFSNTEKLQLDPRVNHFFPKLLKTKNKSAKKNKGETCYADWCCSASIGKKVKLIFDRATQTPSSVLAAINLKYDIELDEIKESFIGFHDVLEDYDLDESEDSSDDDY